MPEPGSARPTDAQARHIPRLEMPAAEAARLRSQLVTSFEARYRRRAGRRRLLLSAGLLLGGVGLAAAYLLAPPRVSLVAEDSPPTGFEAAALDKHRQLLEGGTPELATASPAEIRAWLAGRGLAARLALERPVAERARFLARAADPVEGLPFAAAAVHYRIDEMPVTLLAARAHDVGDSPRWSLLRKRVRWKVDPESGARLLSWTNSGQAYTLVSELPHRGLRACLLCHTDAARRRLVERLDS